ncbi:chalcone isomerase family protein [Massilia sp. TS11]|uniref:chalcone isomerase family protein n=1 Tax=Massilia sp. TS11 TaxID=2908003 RepID=UPI001EDA481A|nr:chalcone isomerase family protein [Massilia sp. TS11]MCG2585216.1 chalcone isomerase family protein [Massilia sp. TS11]
MMSFASPRLRHWFAALALSAASGLASAAVSVGDAKFEDTAKVAGKELKLNGAGMRTRLIIKVYAAGLYLPEKKSNPADIQKLEGPRRVTLIMQRDISSEDFGAAFMKGLKENTDRAETTKILSQTMAFGEMFQSIPGVKKGDVLHLDWIPGQGTICELNGKKIGETLPDVAFYNAVLRIWIGEKPVDSSLKPALLGEK